MLGQTGEVERKATQSKEPPYIQCRVYTYVHTYSPYQLYGVENIHCTECVLGTEHLQPPLRTGELNRDCTACMNSTWDEDFGGWQKGRHTYIVGSTRCYIVITPRQHMDVARCTANLYTYSTVLLRYMYRDCTVGTECGPQGSGLHAMYGSTARGRIPPLPLS